MWKTRTVAVIAVAASFALAGCGSSSKATTSAPATTAPVTLTVLAASSLTNIGPQLAAEFTKAHPNMTIKYSFGGSDTLAAAGHRRRAGRCVRSRRRQPHEDVTDAGDADGTPANFVRNQLEIATPPGNPKGIASLADLTKPGLKVVCAT